MSSSAGPGDLDEITRRRHLKRMQAIATGLLALMAVVFVAASLAIRQWPFAASWLGAVRAFAEAGMVGACADWFAVTALFRRPLGLPIPHTGIIPRNKERIGQALGRFIAQNFLTPEVLSAKLRQLEVARWGGEWLARPQQAGRLARRITAVAPQLLGMLPPNAMRDAVGSGALAIAGAVPAAPTASKVLSALWSEGRSQVALDWGVERLAAYLAEHEPDILTQVEAQSGRWMPKFVDRLIANKIGGGLQKLLQDMTESDHPWRQEIHDLIDRFIVRLATDPELAAQAEALKLRLIHDPRLHAQAQALWADLEAHLVAGDNDALARRLEQLLLSFGVWLRSADAAQDRLNEWARLIALRLLAPRRHEIGRFVSEVVAAWDTRGIVDKLELQVGADLVYIRINGTLVGGLVGLLIYGVARALNL